VRTVSLMPRLERIEQLSDEDRKAVIAPLDEYTTGEGFAWAPKEIAIVLRDEDGTIVGGVIGQANWEWLFVYQLAVSVRLRGQGWGARLMAEIERIAVEEYGCHSAWLDTFSFQARPFYERVGYRVFGELPDYPTGHTRFFMAKRLRA
jgi:ribosomal protein S18 acetylase RimI-like enzyme